MSQDFFCLSLTLFFFYYCFLFDTNQDINDSTINFMKNISNYLLHLVQGEYQHIVLLVCLLLERVEQDIEVDVHVVQVEEVDQIDQEIVPDFLQFDENLHVIVVIILLMQHYY
jgi:hypothetical protein